MDNDTQMSSEQNSGTFGFLTFHQLSHGAKPLASIQEVRQANVCLHVTYYTNDLFKFLEITVMTSGRFASSEGTSLVGKPRQMTYFCCK